MTDSSRYATHKNNPTDYRRAKHLRYNSTDGEQVLWYELRLAAKHAGLRFRRQHPLHLYIVDFVCLNLRLIIEVDDCSHDTRLDADKKRDEHLAAMGYEILRFTNEEVIQNRNGVVEVILNRAEKVTRDVVHPLHQGCPLLSKESSKSIRKHCTDSPPLAGGARGGVE